MEYDRIFSIEKEIDHIKEKLKYIKGRYVRKRAKLITKTLFCRSIEIDATLKEVEALEREIDVLEKEMATKRSELSIVSQVRAV